MSSTNLTEPFTLYYATYSVRSTQIRLTLALRGQPSDGRPDMVVHEQMMDIGPFKPEQLTEDFLLKANPDGAVPALVNDKLLAHPIHETVDITWYLCEWYPELLPPQHEETIRSLIAELHEISFPVLTFGSSDTHALELNEEVQKILSRTDISDEYRAALEYKSKVLLKLHASIVAPGADVEHASRAQKFAANIVALTEANGTTPGLIGDGNQIGYIFGPEPTALDAHVLAFLQRVHESKHDDLIPDVLVQWAEKFTQGDIWKKEILRGPTIPTAVIEEDNEDNVEEGDNEVNTGEALY